jgi:hypothetical protein
MSRYVTLSSSTRNPCGVGCWNSHCERLPLRAESIGGPWGFLTIIFTRQMVQVFGEPTASHPTGYVQNMLDGCFNDCIQYFPIVQRLGTVLSGRRSAIRCHRASKLRSWIVSDATCQAGTSGRDGVCPGLQQTQRDRTVLGPIVPLWMNPSTAHASIGRHNKNLVRSCTVPGLRTPVGTAPRPLLRAFRSGQLRLGWAACVDQRIQGRPDPPRSS